MSKAHARLAYTGDFEPGTMDARVLGPAIIGLAEVCERANECLNENRARATVRIKADFKTGSFEIVYDLVQSLSDHARRLAGLDPAIVGPKEILGFLGLVGTAASSGVISAFRLIRAWHDTQPDMDLQADSDGKVSLKLHGKAYRVKQEIVELAKYPPLREALAGLTRPLSEPGVEAIEIRDPNPRKKKVVDVITKEEALLLSAPVVETPLMAPDETTHTGKRVAVLQIVRAGLVGDVTWTFSEGEGTSPFSPPIEDKEFLERRDRGEIAFRSGDYVRVEIEWQSVIGASHKLKQRIVRVLEYIPRPVQTSLLTPPPPAKEPDRSN